MQVRLLDALDERGRLASDQCHGGDLSLPERLERNLLRFVRQGDRDFQLLEEAGRGYCRSAAMRADIQLAVREIRDSLDLASCQQVKFFVVKFGDVISAGIRRGDQFLQIGRGRVGKECRSGWAPYNEKKTGEST